MKKQWNISDFIMILFIGQAYLSWVYTGESQPDISGKTKEEDAKERKRRLQGQLSKALAVLGIKASTFHSLAVRNQSDEVRISSNTNCS